MSESKRFQDWEEVSCNGCARYYDNSCDGVSKGSKRTCNSFLATRSVVLPEQIKACQNAIKWLTGAIVIEFGIILGIIIVMVGG